MMEIACTHCARHIRVPQIQPGVGVKCPYCQQVFVYSPTGEPAVAAAGAVVGAGAGVGAGVNGAGVEFNGAGAAPMAGAPVSSAGARMVGAVPMRPPGAPMSVARPMPGDPGGPMPAPPAPPAAPAPPASSAARMVDLACTACGKGLRIPAVAPGTGVRCPYCQNVFVYAPPASNGMSAGMPVTPPPLPPTLPPVSSHGAVMPPPVMPPAVMPPPIPSRAAQFPGAPVPVPVPVPVTPAPVTPVPVTPVPVTPGAPAAPAATANAGGTQENSLVKALAIVEKTSPKTAFRSGPGGAPMTTMMRRRRNETGAQLVIGGVAVVLVIGVVVLAVVLTRSSTEANNPPGGKDDVVKRDKKPTPPDPTNPGGGPNPSIPTPPVKPPPEGADGAGYRTSADLPANDRNSNINPNIKVEFEGVTDAEVDDSVGGAAGALVLGKIRNEGPDALASAKLMVVRYVRDPNAPNGWKSQKSTQVTVKVVPTRESVEFRLRVPWKASDLKDFAIVPFNGEITPERWLNVKVSDGNSGLEIAPSAAGDGTLEVQGTVTNNSGKDLQEFRVVVEFYDGDNRFLEAISKEWTWDGVGPKLVAGGSMAFKAATVRTRERDVVGSGRIIVRGIGKIGG
jgi:DNA-directed RNA polymerase subunit RPC12/RpoP